MNIQSECITLNNPTYNSVYFYIMMIILEDDKEVNQTSSPEVIARTRSVSEVMESSVVSHNDVSLIDTRQQLSYGMAVVTHRKIFDNPYRTLLVLAAD